MVVSHAPSLAVAILGIAALAVPAAGLRRPASQDARLAPLGASRAGAESHPTLMREVAGAPPVLSVDDGTYEAAFGIVSGDGRSGNQGVFLNRLTPDPGLLPLTIDTVSVLFPVSTAAGPTGLSNGTPFDVLVFVDPSGSGDPANATTAVQQPFLVSPSNTTFQDVRLGTPVVVQSGDVWVGYTNTVTRSDNLPIFPAAADTNGVLQNRSFAFFNRQPGNHFNGPLGTAEVATQVTANWLIRASGQTGGNTRVCWSAPASGTGPAGSPTPPPTNTRICSSVPPFPMAAMTTGPRDMLLGYNVYRSNQPGVQPTPENFFTSTPPTQTSTSTSVSPSGSFFVITGVYDTGESGPSNELAIVPATITKLNVTNNKIAARGTNFTATVQVLMDGIPFATPSALKKNGTRVVQKGTLVTGQTVGQYLDANGGRAKILFRNTDGGLTTMDFAR